MRLMNKMIADRLELVQPDFFAESPLDSARIVMDFLEKGRLRSEKAMNIPKVIAIGEPAVPRDSV